MASRVYFRFGLAPAERYTSFYATGFIYIIAFSFILESQLIAIEYTIQYANNLDIKLTIRLKLILRLA